MKNMPTQMNDDGTVTDAGTMETQKGYDAYQAEGSKKQKELEARDEKTKDTGKKLLDFGSDMLKRPMKIEKKAKGGPISKAVMQKAGFYDKGKTEKEQQDIVKKVTTKPQRVAMVAKAFSTKNMNKGGSVAGCLATRGYGISKHGKSK